MKTPAKYISMHFFVVVKGSMNPLYDKKKTQMVVRSLSTKTSLQLACADNHHSFKYMYIYIHVCWISTAHYKRYV